MRTLGLFLFCYHLQTIIVAKSTSELKYLGNCRESDITSLCHLENTQYGMSSSNTNEFNTTVVYMDNMDHLNLTVEAYKCKSSSETDCRLLMTVPISDYCGRLRQKGQFYSAFTENAEPPIVCPLKKGTHRVTHAAVNLNLVNAFMDDKSIYMVKFIFDYHGTSAGCFMAKLTKKTELKKKLTV